MKENPRKVSKSAIKSENALNEKKISLCCQQLIFALKS